ncbi:MAG: GxxExxY protein [Pyrinomonadaceae bacterium]|nr:GxxExxY protein [Pyrinomonadaceae bacterium]MBP6212427.1 GxxExxY protein [Pyrinomonadaceae bacterium]
MDAETPKPKSRDELNEISGKIIEYSIEVHKELGPGMLEGAYEICLMHELVRNGFRVERQVLLPIRYQGIMLDAGYRIDLLVESSVIVELKAVDRLLPVHEAQLLSYLRMSDLRLGLLINFNVRLLRDGIRRVVNNF